MELTKALAISGRCMEAQGTRLRMIAETLADPHGAGFEHAMDSSPRAEERAFAPKSDPSTPAANAQGHLEQSDGSGLAEEAEVTPMREALRTYHANLSVMQASRSMLTRAIEMLK
ncbi:MAG: hypothetical protein JO264_01245 [Acidisphaera sp.]|nr:hypothetical protein [Acidisphaera sp.]